MRIRWLLTGWLTVLFPQITLPADGFVIRGKTGSPFTGYIYLTCLNRTDSALLREGAFTFSGRVEYPAEAVLHLNNGVMSQEGTFFLENSRMNMTVEILQGGVYLYEISGNKSAAILAELQEYMEQHSGDKNYPQDLYARMSKIASENPRNQLTGILMAELSRESLFSAGQLSAMYARLDTAVQHAGAMRLLRMAIRKWERFRLGEDLPAIVFPDETGKSVSSAQFSGKVLLVYFWGSWCVPCRESFPALSDLYRQYHPRGFEIMGVGVEDSRDAWNTAWKALRLPWVQTLALGEFNNKAVQDAGIWETPGSYLADRDGRLIAVNPSTEQLSVALNGLFPR